MIFLFSKCRLKADDWEIYFTLECESIVVARKTEPQIKKMKSRIYITNLLIYKEVSEKLFKDLETRRIVNREFFKLKLFC